MGQGMGSAAASTVGIREIVTRLPEFALDMPSIVRNLRGLLNRPNTKFSVGLVFQRAAHRYPDRPFLRFEGSEYTYREANAMVNRYAAVLTERGVRRGDVVGIMLANRPETLLLLLATVKLGATAGMLNSQQRDEVLAHSIGLLAARLLVVGAECADAVTALGDGQTEMITAEDLAEAARTADAADPAACAEVTAQEQAFLIFTSGTTGMPKASVMTHLRWGKGLAGFGGIGVRLHAGDTMYCCLPLYHNNALTVALGSVLTGGAALALARKFSASKHWDNIIRERATAFIYIGELGRYLLNQPVKPVEQQHQVRVVVGNGLRPELWDEFRTRFGIRRIVEFYGASEGPAAFINVFGVDKTAGAGLLPYAVVEYDEETGKARRGPDGLLRRVPRGEIGLLLCKITSRARFDGYTDTEASEKKLVRDGFKPGDVWFDTGDLVLHQGLNHIAFVDRLGDTFRWKGENVATTQVEGAIAAEASIDQAVVYGVTVPGADGKAGMATITLHEAADFDGVEVGQRLYERLPSYAVPLFVRVVDQLEATSTFKSRKVELRNAGYSNEIEGSLYVLAGREEGYVPAYDDYVAEVAKGICPR